MTQKMSSVMLDEFLESPKTAANSGKRSALNKKPPFVSIIIPVFNNAAGLERTLHGIKNQTYPADCFETIVVDNGSEDDPRAVADRFGTIYLEEHKFLNSPYSARNRGIEIAKGEIILLLDTTCKPVETWLERGVEKIREGYDLVGGNVIFDVNKNSSAGELYDSLLNIQMEKVITERNVAKTTNLFIRKEVFDCIGPFPEGLRSGGDVRWTAKAVNVGFKLAFSENAAVHMTPRPLFPLLKKQLRVAKGFPASWLERGIFLKNFARQMLFLPLPPDPFKFSKKLKGTPVFYKKKIIRLYLIAYLVGVLMPIGTAVGTFSLIISHICSRKKKERI